MSVLSEFAERLNGLMTLKNVKSEQIGKEIGVSGSIVRYWQRSAKQISLPNLLKLADYFGCTMDFLAGRSDEEMTFIPQTPPPFSQAIRRVFSERGISRYQFANIMNCCDNYIYSWDHGSQPDLSTLIKLATIFNCTIDYLVGREN